MIKAGETTRIKVNTALSLNDVLLHENTTDKVDVMLMPSEPQLPVQTVAPLPGQKQAASRMAVMNQSAALAGRG